MKFVFMSLIVAVLAAGCCKKVEMLDGSCPIDGCCVKTCVKNCNCPSGHCQCPDDCKNCGQCKK